MLVAGLVCVDAVVAAAVVLVVVELVLVLVADNRGARGAARFGASGRTALLNVGSLSSLSVCSLSVCACAYGIRLGAGCLAPSDGLVVLDAAVDVAVPLRACVPVCVCVGAGCPVFLARPMSPTRPTTPAPACDRACDRVCEEAAAFGCEIEWGPITSSGRGKGECREEGGERERVDKGRTAIGGPALAAFVASCLRGALMLAACVCGCGCPCAAEEAAAAEAEGAGTVARVFLGAFGAVSASC